MRNRLLALAMLGHALAAIPTSPVANAVPEPRVPRRGPKVVPVREGARKSAHVPHQNVREAARRVGGQVWLDYRNADRKHRGLPPLDR